MLLVMGSKRPATRQPNQLHLSLLHCCGASNPHKTRAETMEHKITKPHCLAMVTRQRGDQDHQKPQKPPKTCMCTQ